MHKEPLCFSLGRVRLVWLKGAYVKFGCIDGFPNRMLEEVKHKLKERGKAGVFFNAGSIVFFDGE